MMGPRDPNRDVRPVDAGRVAPDRGRMRLTHSIGLGAIVLAASGAVVGACTGDVGSVAIENRTMRNVAVYIGGPSIFVPACGRVFLDAGDLSRPRTAGPPDPPGTVWITYHLPAAPDAPIHGEILITSNGVFNGIPSPPPACEGEPRPWNR